MQLVLEPESQIWRELKVLKSRLRVIREGVGVPRRRHRPLAAHGHHWLVTVGDAISSLFLPLEREGQISVAVHAM
jgi:hypothetical protein